MSLLVFLFIALIGFLLVAAVIGGVAMLAMAIWQRRTGRQIFSSGMDQRFHESQRMTGQDQAHEHSAQALRSHPGPPPPGISN